MSYGPKMSKYIFKFSGNKQGLMAQRGSNVFKKLRNNLLVLQLVSLRKGRSKVRKRIREKFD